MTIKMIIMAILLPAIGSCQSDGAFTLSGTMKNMCLPVKSVYLKSMEENDKTYQVIVKNGKYLIKGTLDGPTKMNIVPIYGKQVDRTKLDKEVLFIYLEPGRTKIKHTGSFGNIIVSGSESEAAHEKLAAMVKEKEATQAARQEIKELYGNYVKAHPASPIAVYALNSYAENERPGDAGEVSYGNMPFSVEDIYLAYNGRTDAAKAIPLFHLLPASLQQSAAGRNFARELEWGLLDIAVKPYMIRLDSLVKGYAQALKDSNIQQMDEMEVKMKEIAATIREEVYAGYLKNDPGSPLAVQVLKFYSGSNFSNPARSAQLFSGLSDEVKLSPEGKEFAQRLKLALKTAIGQPAPLFSLTDTAGNLVSLQSFRGKYALLDFWASWCGPCRKENPNVIAAYNRYKDKGFTVISVSLDTDKRKWLDAIHQDQMNWTHISDLKAKNEVVALYDILGIPANLLIGPDGKIVAKNLTGALLMDKLKEVILPTNIGLTAPDFTQADTSGKPVSLQSFRGKYVLVDFWASWCVPCRAENPNVVAAYNQYKDKGFTVLGVSLDKDKQKWLDAIHKDQLDWTQVSDLKYWKNEAAILYHVIGVPDNFLIGPDGKIIAKDLTGNDLQEKLAELIRE